MSPRNIRKKFRPLKLRLVDATSNPPYGATLEITQGRRRRLEYDLYELPNASPQMRGVLLMAIARNGERSLKNTEWPPELVVRYPDLKPFEKVIPPRERDQAVATYLRSFEAELMSELALIQLFKTRTGLVPVAREWPRKRKKPFQVDVPFRSGTRKAPILLRDYIEGRTLAETYQEIRDNADALIWYKAWINDAERLIRLLHHVHMAGAPHGYLCPANVLVHKDKRSFCLVNFERNLPDPALFITSENSLWKERASLAWRRPYDSPERTCYFRGPFPESETNDPFVPGDIYSLGLTLLWMCTGELFTPYQDERGWSHHPERIITEREIEDLCFPWYRIKQPVRKPDRKVKEEVIRLVNGASRTGGWSYSDKMAAVEIIFSCLRLTDHRLYNARAILEVLYQCDRDPRPRKSGIISILEEKYKTGHEEMKGTLLERLYEARLYRALLPLEEMEQPKAAPAIQPLRYTVSTRAHIVDAVVTMFLSMEDLGYDRCRAMTTAGVFSDTNWTSRGRVFSAILRAAEDGAEVEWLFVLNASRLNDPAVIDVFDAQKTGWNELQNLETRPKVEPQIRWVDKSASEYRAYLRDFHSFLYFTREAEPNGGKNPEPVFVVPDFASEPGRIIAIRAFPIPKGKRSEDPADPCERAVNQQAFFDREWKGARPLSSFPHKLSGG